MLLLCVTYILKTDGVTTSLLPTCWTKESLRSVLDCVYLGDYLKSKVAITNKTVLFWWGLIFAFFPPLLLYSPLEMKIPAWLHLARKAFPFLSPSFRADLKAHNLPPLIISWPSLIPRRGLLLLWLARAGRCRGLSGSFEDIPFVHMDTHIPALQLLNDTSHSPWIGAWSRRRQSQVSCSSPDPSVFSTSFTLYRLWGLFFPPVRSSFFFFLPL